MPRIVVAAALGLSLGAALAAAAPEAPSTRTLATRGPVLAVSADGARAALVVGGRHGCAAVVVWEPLRRRVVRLQSPGACESGDFSPREGTRAVALAGTRAAWLRTAGGNTVETILLSATLARPKPVWIAFDTSDEGGTGSVVGPPSGDGALLAFDIQRRCSEMEGSTFACPPGKRHGDVFATNVWKVAGNGPCPSPGRVRGCTVLAETEEERTVLTVGGGRIVVRTPSEVWLLSSNGSFRRRFSFVARAAALEGNRLALRTSNAIQVLDVRNGASIARLPAAAGLRLEDLHGDVLVTASGGTITLRRLTNGRTTTFRPGGTARAQLESPGLVLAGGRRVTFTPMRDVLRRLGAI